MSSTTTAVNGGTIHSNLPLQYKALTSVPTYQAVVVHPMSRKFVCNEPQIPLGIQCSLILPVSNEKEGPSIHVVQYGTWSLWLCMCVLYTLPLYM